VKREAYVDPGEVMHELEDYFRVNPDGADVLTFSSAGEPTLYEPLGELIGAVKKRFPRMPLIVLTNGSLLWMPEARKGLALADRVAPTVSSLTDSVFRAIHRPHPSLRLEDILEGLRAFRRDFRGELHLEVMLVVGCNDHPVEWRELARFAESLRPERIELNTVIRPPADPEARPLTREEMEIALGCFPMDKSEIIGCFEARRISEGGGDLAERIVAMVERRPCTTEEMAASLGASLEEVHKALDVLVEANRVERSSFGAGEHIRPVGSAKLREGSGAALDFE
jgi:wyosine [tRNA(Phe)-imidazoG37] synthetase (radical SAM superfamily)